MTDNRNTNKKKKHRWTTADIPDLSGKIAIVTGANSGTGFEITKSLAEKDAHVIMACRSTERGEAAAELILEEYSDASLKVMQLDLADLSSVRSFAEAFKQQYQSLDILCNNAGVMQTPYLKTKDDFELQFGTNHLGHFALTGLLLDLLLKTEGSRVVTMSSSVHSMGKIDFDSLNGEKPRSYRGVTAYAQSKLANLLFTYELQRKLENKGASAISVGAHPGYSATNLQSAGLGLGKSFSGRMMRLTYRILNKVVAQSAEKGALPVLMAATEPDIKGGEYIGPKGITGMRGYPGKTKSSKRSHDLDTAKQLWEVSEELTGVKYSEIQT